MPTNRRSCASRTKTRQKTAGRERMNSSSIAISVVAVMLFGVVTPASRDPRDL